MANPRPRLNLGNLPVHELWIQILKLQNILPIDKKKLTWSITKFISWKGKKQIA